MPKTDAKQALDKLGRLNEEFQVDVLTEWGESGSGGGGGSEEAKPGAWTIAELDRLHDTLTLLSNAMGGNQNFVKNLVKVTVKKSDIGSHGGEAVAHKVSFSEKGSLGAWTVIHEFAHAWDARHDWKLAKALEKYTGGFTSRLFSGIQQFFGLRDSAYRKAENLPGRRGRRPGCNAAGYFYGDKPSGSNWKFNRVEDFAESVAMYIGWEKDNALSEHARNRIVRYTFSDGEKDAFNVSDNWSVYKRYFYPEGGDYTKTLRWKYIDRLLKGEL